MVTVHGVYLRDETFHHSSKVDVPPRYACELMCVDVRRSMLSHAVPERDEISTFINTPFHIALHAQCDPVPASWSVS